MNLFSLFWIDRIESSDYQREIKDSGGMLVTYFSRLCFMFGPEMKVKILEVIHQIMISN